MKLYVWSFILLIFSSACSAEQDTLADESMAATQEISLSFKVRVDQDKLKQPATRANTSTLKHLRLLIFNEHDEFLYAREAVLESSSSNSYSYSVMLELSKHKRVIHFVGNYAWTAQDEQKLEVGQPASYILGSLESSEPAYWAELSLDRIDETSFNTTSIELLSNQATIEVLCDPALTEFTLKEYALYNPVSRGTVVPQPSGGKFTSTPSSPTMPRVYKYLTQPIFISSGSVLSLFEHPNDSDATRLYILIRGRHKDAASDVYYKLNIQRKNNINNVQPDCQSIIRNRAYKLVITQLTHRGYSTLDEALSNMSANEQPNYTFVESSKNLVVTNGIDYMEVSKIKDVLVRKGDKFYSTIYTNLNLQDLLLQQLWSDNGIGGEYFNGYKFAESDDRTHSYIQLVLKDTPRAEHHMFQLILRGVIDTDKILKVELCIFIRPPYDFAAKLTHQSGTDYQLSFKVPSDLKEFLLPLDVYFTTPNLSPEGRENLSIESSSEAGYRYKYTIRSRSEIGKTQYINLKALPNTSSVSLELSSAKFHTAKLSS